MDSRARLRSIQKKSRVFIVSDISNEPDDAESLVRYFLYANEFDTRGIVACTSTWMKRVVHPEDMVKIIKAYGKVVSNLNAHSHPDHSYPSESSLLALIKSGPALYGKEALAEDVALSEGSQHLIDEVDTTGDPLWVLCWGGTNVLAQALKHVALTRSADEAATFRAKIRVYAISDQDDTGMWIRLRYPDVFYIASAHGWNQYGLAAWTAISGDKYYGFDQGGPDFTKMEKSWIKEYIQVGPLGSAYPDYLFIPEGDTPTFLYLIPNGLGQPEHPNWGSWGGRYLLTDAAQAGKHYTDAVDRVQGLDGRLHTSNHATIWRWRDAFQNDFAARMRWTLTPVFTEANHQPVAVVNESSGTTPLYLEAEVGTRIVLDASKSYDPDGDSLSFSWMHYKDVTATQWWVDAEVPDVQFEDSNGQCPGQIVSVVLPPAERCAVDMFSKKPLRKGQILHFILTVEDSGSPSLVTYKRVVVQITNNKLAGGGGKAVDSIADVHGFA